MRISRYRQLLADKLEKEDVLKQGQAEEMLQADLKILQEANDQLDAEKALVEPLPQPPPPRRRAKGQNGCHT